MELETQIQRILDDFEKYPIRLQEYWNSYGEISYRNETPSERLKRTMILLRKSLNPLFDEEKKKKK